MAPRKFLQFTQVVSFLGRRHGHGQAKVDYEHYNYNVETFKMSPSYYKRSSNSEFSPSCFLPSCLEDRLETIILRIAAPSICFKNFNYRLGKMI